MTSFTCEDLSCGFIDRSLSRPESYVATSFISFWRRDIEMMSRHEFLHLTVSFNLDHVFFVATSFFKSRLHLFTFQFLLQSQIVDVVTWNCWKLNFLSRLKFPVVTSILLEADFFLFLLKFEFLLYFPTNWNLSQLSLFYGQFNIIFILNSEKWIKNQMSF